MPIRMPSIVSAERSRWVRIASQPVRNVSRQFMRRPPARRRSASSWPSRIRMTRSARAATSASWVISTIVRPARGVRRQGEHVGGGRGVEVAGGFVGQDQRRLGDQRPGDGDPLLLAAGQLAGPVLDPVGEADPVQGAPAPAPGARRGRRPA